MILRVPSKNVGPLPGCDTLDKNPVHRKLWLTVLPFFFLVAAVCGGGKAAAPTTGQTETPPAACAPSGTSLEVTADDFKFDKACLAVAANHAFTIRFNNNDYHVDHNVAIYAEDRRASRSTRALFKGAFFFGPKTMTYDVPALPQGSYYFHCDAHAFTMVGVFIVS